MPSVGVRVAASDAVFVSPYIRVRVSESEHEDKCISIEFMMPLPERGVGEAVLCDSDGVKLAYIAKRIYRDIDKGYLNINQYMGMVSSAFLKKPSP